MDMERGLRIRRRREELNLTQKDLAELVGCSQPNIKKIEAGSDTKLIFELARALQVPPEYVKGGIYEPRTGSGPSLISSMDSISHYANNPDRRSETPGRRGADYENRGRSGEIVILELKATGGSMGSGLLLRDQPGEIHQWSVTPEWITKNVKNYTGTQNLRIVTGFGDSMRPLYNPGDPLLVDAGVRSVDFDSIYFFRIGDEGFIKRLQRVPGQGLLAISENKSYRDWVITPEMDFEVFARVIKVWCGSEF